jgi:lipid-A-disaccharide synthase-like uncharacterized protein
MSDDRVTLAWQIVGYSSNVLFAASFVFQWWVSERKKRSVIPLGFWWMRIAAAAALLSYALRVWEHQGPVILGQVTGLLTYTRNLVLIRRARLRGPAGSAPK